MNGRFQVAAAAIAAVALFMHAAGAQGNGGSGPAAKAQGAAAKAQGAAAPSGAATYTAEQAVRGERVYQNVCIECHEKLEYTGADFRVKWNGRTVFDLFDLLRTTMPDEDPGILSRQEYADVLGYMLKLNGVPPGATPVSTDDAALKKVKIDIPAK